MKLINILEDVIDLSKRREQKRKKQSIPAEQLLSDIDAAIEVTIGDLIHQGMSQDEARRFVIKHVSDVVMSYDLE
ncbi:hypothetical protein LCGC14_2087020 [marine sediment metagenome]|uniref:Uncharacterized protein n=1 Tax=marine sediment metagenome TaxID=412755 RepID=A0A0F9F190_9ZZZZ